MRWWASPTYWLCGYFSMSCWKASKDLLRVDRRALRQIDVEAPLQPVGLALEVHQALHVVGVVDARIGRIFADEGVGGVDRRVGLAVLVVGVDQVELRLAGRFAEGKARLQRFELLDGLAVARILHGLLRLAHRSLRGRIWPRRARWLRQPVASIASADGDAAARGSDGQDHAVSQAIPYNGP